MKTFISAVFLMLAAYASAQEFEPYEQHVTSAKGAEEMQLFGALDEIVAVYKGDKDSKEKDHKSKDKKDHKDDKKGHKDDKSKHHNDDKSKHHKNRDNSDSSSKSDKSTHRSSSSSSRSKRNYSSKSSSSSSSRSSSSSSSSSKSRKNGRSKKHKNRSDLHEGICDCKMKDRDEKFCDDAWDELCKPSARPDTTEYDFCDDFLGIYDCTSQFSSFDGHGRTNLRGNVAEE